MNYQKHYDLLINTRKQLNREKNKGQYFEQHHIIPKSLGGNNLKENLVFLTPREHFIAHWLLYRIHRNKSTAAAFYRMCHKGSKNMKRYIPSSRAYEEARTAYIEENKGKPKHNEISKKNIGLKNKKPKPLHYGQNLSKMMKQGLAKKISESNKGISRGKGRKIDWNVGRPKTTIYQHDLNNNLIKTWIGIEELKNIFSISLIYKAFKTDKPYKNFLWKKSN
jgi:hypothetical protein